MKRLLSLIVLSLISIQMLLIPASVNAVVNGGCPYTIDLTTSPATDITNTSAWLRGTCCIDFGTNSDLSTEEIESNKGGEGTVVFQYGTTLGVYTTEITADVVSAGDVNGRFCRTFKALVQNLGPCTTYYVRLKRTCSSYSRSFDSVTAGAGAGLDGRQLVELLFNSYSCPNVYYGNEISFQTTGCQVGAGQLASPSGPVGTYGFTPPVNNPIIITQSASLSAKSVTPGTPVTVTADVINKSTANGSKKVTLYVNGQVETTQGIIVNSGGSSQLTFNISRSEPGNYNVYVDGVPAGSFKVELFRESDGILVFSAALVAIAFILGMVMLGRRQRAGQN